MKPLNVISTVPNDALSYGSCVEVNLKVPELKVPVANGSPAGSGHHGPLNSNENINEDVRSTLAQSDGRGAKVPRGPMAFNKCLEYVKKTVRKIKSKDNAKTKAPK
ncbi:hypothetical protein H0H92_015818, partial [Tricholoma furcatifolium]